MVLRKDLKGIEEPDEKKDRERAFFANLKKLDTDTSRQVVLKKLKDWSLKLLKGDLTKKCKRQNYP